MNNFFKEIHDNRTRVEALEAQAHKILPDSSYLKPLTESELEERREMLADNCIRMNELNIRKKEAALLLKAEQKPLAEMNSLILTEIKTKNREVKGTLYLVDNQPEGMMETYTEDGELISSRRLRPDEKQGNIFQISKAQ